MTIRTWLAVAGALLGLAAPPAEAQIADLSVSVTASPSPVPLGAQLTYTVTIANDGPLLATFISLLDVLPAGTTFVSVTPSAQCNGGSLVTCSSLALLPGASMDVVIVVTVTDPGVKKNRASVSSLLIDDDSTNNVAVTFTRVTSWQPTGRLAQPRSGHSATLLQTGRVLVAGGQGPTGVLASAELYDPATGQWTPAGALGTPRMSHSATLLPDGRVLVAGGNAGPSAGALDTAETYDPASDSWTPVSALLADAREAHTATLLTDGRVLVAGGSGLLGSLDTTEVFDAGAGSWTATAPLGRPRAAHTATLLPDGHVLVAGGSGDATSETYDPGADGWSPVVDPLSAPRERHTATLLPDGRVAVAGGIGAGGLTEAYDPGSRTWSDLAAGGRGRAEHVAALLPEGRLVVAGGAGPGPEGATSDVFDPGSGTWAEGPGMSVRRGGASVTLLPDGRVLVAGGRDDSTSALLASAEILETSGGRWSATGGMVAARGGHTATLLPSGKVLLVNNPPGGGPHAELYDPATGAFSASGNLFQRRSQHTATLLLDGRVLAVGGQGGGAPLAPAESYDPASGAWSTTGSLGAGRINHTATLLPCGRVLIAGGQDFSATFASAEVYDPLTGTFGPTGSMGTARRRHEAVLLADGRVLVAGGCCGAAATSAEIYDPATGAWSPTGSLGAGREAFTLTRLPSGKVLAVGGLSSSASAEVFDPATGAWSPTASLSEGRSSHTATLLPGGQVLVAIGFTGSSTFTGVEVYDPARGAWTRDTDASVNRSSHTATLLADGRVLVAGGDGFGATAEVYEPGLGFAAAWRPVLATATDPLVEASALVATGSGFRGVSEASGGNHGQNASTDYPLVQLRRIEDEAVRWLPVAPTGSWSDVDFRSATLTGLRPGHALATVFTNGIPGVSRIVSIECPAPAIGDDPSPEAVCPGAAATFTVSATGDCLGYQWRKDGVPLAEGGRYSGTRTPSLLVSPVDPADAGGYDVVVQAACSGQAATSVQAGLVVVAAPTSTIAVAGSTVLCPGCAGGTATVTAVGGGTVDHQWGYRTSLGGPFVEIPGETLSSYDIQASDLGGPGVYFLAARSRFLTCGAAVYSNDVKVIVYAAGPAAEMPFLTSTSKAGQVKLEWINPGAPYEGTLVRYNTAPSAASCAPPADPGDGTQLALVAGSPDGKDALTHDGLADGTVYCYRVFVHQGGGLVSPAGTITGRPFDTTLVKPKWAYNAGGFSIVPPGNGNGRIHAVAQDTLHSMVKGAAGGTWPAGWLPRSLAGPSQGRPTTLNLPVPVAGASRVIFLGSQGGFVYALDADTGGVAWPSALPDPVPSPVQAAPSAWLSFFGGDPGTDHLLVGTRNGDIGAENVFYALDLAGGSVAWSYDGNADSRKIGMISGQATVDYVNRRVYFASVAFGTGSGETDTVWCLDLTDGSLVWAAAIPDVTGSPIARNGRLYVGSHDGGPGGAEVHALDAATGASVWGGSTFDAGFGEGPVKLYVGADRLSPAGRLLFSTTNRIFALNDQPGSTAPPEEGDIVWVRDALTDTGPIPDPSTPAYLGGGPSLWVGSSDGHLYRLDYETGATQEAIALGEADAAVGSPTLDVREGFLYVGTEAGIVYAVQMN